MNWVQMVKAAAKSGLEGLQWTGWGDGKGVMVPIWLSAGGRMSWIEPGCDLLLIPALCSSYHRDSEWWIKFWKVIFTMYTLPEEPILLYTRIWPGSEVSSIDEEYSEGGGVSLWLELLIMWSRSFPAGKLRGIECAEGGAGDVRFAFISSRSNT